MDLKDLFTIAIYLLPGFLYFELYRKFYPAKHDSDYARILNSLFHSTFFLIVIYLLDSNFHIFKLDLVLETDKNLLKQESLNINLLIILLITAILCAYLRILSNKLRFWIAEKCECLSFLSPKSPSLWYEVNKINQWVVIVKKDSSRFLGWISEFSNDPNDNENNAIFLSDASCVDKKLNEKYKIEGNGLYISRNEISHMEFFV